MKPMLPKHLISDISYSRNVLDCSCGETMSAWPDLAGATAWNEHRRANGQALRSLGQGVRRLKGTFNPRLVL